jgi:hypothetical protein
MMGRYHTDKKVRLLDEIDNAISRLENYKANMMLRNEFKKEMLYDVAQALITEIIKPKDKP